MPWYILSILNIFLITGYYLFQRWTLRDGRYNPNTFAIVLLYCAGLVSLVFAIVTGSADFNYGTLPLLAVVITIVSNALQMLVMARAAQLVEASILGIILNSRTVAIIILSAIFLDEHITAQIVLGGLIVMIGASLVLYEKGQKFTFSRGELYSFLVALLIAVPFISDAFALRDGFDAPSYLALIWIVPGLLVSFLRPMDALQAREYISDWRFWVGTFSAAAALSLAIISIYKAFQIADNASVLSIIAQASSVTIVAFSILVLNERSNLKLKVVASLIVFSGLVLVNY